MSPAACFVPAGRSGFGAACQADLAGVLFHPLDGLPDDLVQGNVQHLAPLADHLPVDPGGERFILELFLDRFDLQVQNAFGRPDQTDRVDEAGQLVDGVEGLFQGAFGLGIAPPPG